MSTVAIASLLPIPVVIPIVGAVAAPLVARIHRRLPLVVSILAMLGSAVVLAVMVPAVYSGYGHVLSHFFGHWGLVNGPGNGAALGIAFTADPFGLTFALVTAVLGMLLLIYVLSELGHLGPHELGWLACLFQLLLAAVIGASLTADTINLFVWFELAALASYGLTGFFLERPTALEAAFKLLVLTSIAGFAVFVGSALLYADHGALNFAQLHNALLSKVGVADLLALALLIAGFGTKAGLVPFHGWLPDAHTAPPGAVSALFSALMYDIGIIGTVHIVLLVFPADSNGRALTLLMVLGIVSALLGAILALAQDDLKRLLAWDTVSQMGILAIGFAAANADGIAGATYHMVNHALFKAMLFLCAGSIVHATGKTRLSEMGGLARHRPLLAVGFTVGAWAIAGVPPMNGYASLGLIHQGLEHAAPAVFYLALLAQVVTIAALARAAYLAFYRRRSEPYERIEPSRAGMRFTMIALGAGCIAFGVLPGPVIRWAISPAASLLLHPGVYAAGMLSGDAPLPAGQVTFAYWNPKELAIAAVTVVLGLVLAALYLRIREPAPVRWLRAVHTGSVNDYAAFAAFGIVACAAVLMV